MSYNDDDLKEEDHEEKELKELPDDLLEDEADILDLDPKSWEEDDEEDLAMLNMHVVDEDEEQ